MQMNRVGVMKLRWVICLGLVGLICGAFPNVAAAIGSTVSATYNPDAVETGFKLRGTNGYSIAVVAYSEGGGAKGTIGITAFRHGASASYGFPARVTADAIRADLGSLGQVNVVRRPSGREKTVRPKCLGGPLTYEPGTFEGLIEFNGEESYTRVKESHATPSSRLCLYSRPVAFVMGAMEKSSAAASLV